MTLPLVLSAVAGLLVVIGLIQPLAERLHVPPSVLLASVGILIGAGAAFLLYSPVTDAFNEIALVFVNLPVDSETFLYVFLPALLFQTALTLDVRRIMEDAAPVLLLAVVAVLVATVAIGYALEPVSGQPLVVCLLLGAIVATTDPVAVIGIFRELGAPARLTRLVEGESLLNDAAAITLFVLLLDLLITGEATSFPKALQAFAVHGIGGAIVGYVGGRIAAGLFRFVRELPAALVTLSVALPYIVYIGGEKLLHVSGVVAVVAAGMTVNLNGPTRVSPDAWRYLRDIWEQLEFWAASLIFVLASILVPRLLGDFDAWEILPVVVVLAAAFASRVAVLFGMLPLLTLLKLSAKVNNRFKIVIAWGGLRGAVTLALALAVTENPAVPETVQRFVATTATGFTLFTLLVNGTTLRWLIRLLRLDRLSPFDAALRDSVLALALGNVRSSILKTGGSSDISPTIIDQVAVKYDQRVDTAVARAESHTEVADRDRLTFGLVALADRERELLLEHFRERTVSTRIIEKLLAETGRLRERARGGGRVEYNRAARRILGYSLSFRVALQVHRLLRSDHFLVEALGDRFERLLIVRIVLSDLAPFVHERIAPILGERIADLIEEIVDQRREATVRALDALELQYPDYSTTLERRFLVRTALRREELEYEDLFQERMIGAEVLHDLRREIARARRLSEVRPVLDLGLNTRELVSHFPLFANLNEQQIGQVTRLLRPRFAVPGERIIRRGERGDAAYFISSGAVEVTTPGEPVRLGRGDFIGELAILTGERRNADVTAIAYCQLLMLDADDFRALLDKAPDIRSEIERVAAERLQRAGTPVVAAAPPTTTGAAAEPDIADTLGYDGFGIESLGLDALGLEAVGLRSPAPPPPPSAAILGLAVAAPPPEGPVPAEAPPPEAPPAAATEAAPAEPLPAGQAKAEPPKGDRPKGGQSKTAEAKARRGDDASALDAPPMGAERLGEITAEPRPAEPRPGGTPPVR